MLESDTHRAGHGFDKRDIEIFMNLEIILVLAALVVMLAALLVLKAARVNPTENLKTE